MSILNKLATSLNRRDEVPNQELAQEIVRTNDAGAVRELVENLFKNNRNIQSDCVKVLDEIGERDPRLIAPYYKDFGKLLDCGNNRLVWGAMTALDRIASLEPKGVYALLANIVAAVDTGSVITRDHAVGILATLGAIPRYAGRCVPLLVEQLATCPANQFPMYAEKSLAVTSPDAAKALHAVIAQRFERLDRESQKKRVAKVLKRMNDHEAS